MTEEKRTSRRDILKKAAYLTPAIITLLAVPSFASHGSGNEPPSRWTAEKSDDEKHSKEFHDHKPKWKPWPRW